MAKKPLFDWHLSDWMDAVDVSQADLVRATGYPKAKLSELTNGVQRYNRDIVNDLAVALNIHPYELLMAPAQAMAFRQYLATAEQIVTLAHENEKPRNDLADRRYKANPPPTEEAPDRGPVRRAK
jgi:transcriptional regulator with XRE-family HTH domain